jgi:hypothetical protein
MSKSAGTQTVTNRLDPETMRMQQEIFNRARTASETPYQAYGGQQVAGIDPVSRQATTGLQQAQGQLANAYQTSMNANERALQTGQEASQLGQQFGAQSGQLGGLAGGFDQQGQAMSQWAGAADQRANQSAQFGSQFGDYAQTGRLGAQAMGGDANATQQLMNPYQQQVLDGVGRDFDKLRSQAHTQSNQAATAAGAFGGSRHGVMEGARLGELDSAQANTIPRCSGRTRTPTSASARDRWISPGASSGRPIARRASRRSRSDRASTSSAWARVSSARATTR